MIKVNFYCPYIKKKKNTFDTCTFPFFPHQVKKKNEEYFWYLYLSLLPLVSQKKWGILSLFIPFPSSLSQSKKKWGILSLFIPFPSSLSQSKKKWGILSLFIPLPSFLTKSKKKWRILLILVPFPSSFSQSKKKKKQGKYTLGKRVWWFEGNPIFIEWLNLSLVLSLSLFFFFFFPVIPIS